MNTLLTEQTGSIPKGIWGGGQISMEVTQGGASIEYACAHGSINTPIKPDSRGRFKAQGTHVKEHPGPVREEESAGEPATYTGRIEGTTMILTVTLTATQQSVGTFTLTHGKRSRIVKCK